MSDIQEDREVIKIVHLYPKELNIYGDNGNLQALTYRLQRYGYESEIVPVGVGDDLPAQFDILLGGGGQDTGQLVVAEDLQAKKDELISARDYGAVMLVICGSYQLFGHYFQTAMGEKIPGIGLFDMATVAGAERLIGNVVIESKWGRLVGFENHSGITELQGDQPFLGRVTKGNGNGGDGTEGAVINNCFGSYLHGPLLPKNPCLTDELIRRALKRKTGKDVELPALEDELAHRAAEIAAERPA